MNLKEQSRPFYWVNVAEEGRWEKAKLGGCQKLLPQSDASKVFRLGSSKQGYDGGHV